MAESPEQVPSEDGNSFLEDELEALRSIYVNETNVFEDSDSTTVSIDLHPATADNLQEQYVKLTLKLTVKDGYPDVIPDIDIRNPRGLSDEKLSSITNDLLKIAEDKRGNSMLFEIIEAAKDYLTAGNRPCEECAICLYGFHDDDIFTKTECYHYFHSHCLARYAKNSSISDDDSKSDDSLKSELLCPVCRLPIHFDGVDDSYPSPVKAEDEFSVTDTILQTQKKLQELFIKQVEKGGIIDLEAEKNKYLIEISHVRSIVDDAAEAKSDEENSLNMPEERDKALLTSSPENAKHDKLDSQKYSSNRSSNSERSDPDRRFTKHNEERRGPFPGNDNRNERYQSNRGSDGYRRYPRSGRNNYDRIYDGYNNDRSDRYSGGVNRNRFSNPRRNNWHENQHKGNRYERRDQYADRNSQRNVKHDKYDDRNSQKYERHDKYDHGSSQRYENPRGQRRKQHDFEEGTLCRDVVEDDVDERSERRDQYDDRNSQRYEKHKYGDRNSQKYERQDKYDHANSQRYENPGGQRKKQHDFGEGVSCKDAVEDDSSHDIDQKSERHDQLDDGNSQKYESHDRYDHENSQRYDKPRGQRKKQHDFGEGASCKDAVEEESSHDIDQRSDGSDDNVQNEQANKVSGEKRNRYGGDRRNVSYGRGYNNQYDDRRENRYDRQNVRYDNNKRYGRFEDNRTGQYDRRNGRFDSRKYNEYNGSKRNEHFSIGRNNRANGVNRNRYLNQENEDKDSKFCKENEVGAKNTSTIEKESEDFGISQEVADDGSRNESEYLAAPNTSSKNFSKDEISDDTESRRETKLSSFSSDRKQNFPSRNSGAHKQNDRNYNRHYQRSNSNGDRNDGASGYSKQSNYHSERRQPKPQNYRRNSDNLDESENSYPIKPKEAVAEGAGEPNESNLEENQVCINEESGDFTDSQHSKRSSTRTDSGNTNHSKNYRDGKQGYNNNRYQNNNRNYNETRPYRNNPRFRNNQSDYSDRTSNGSKRYIPQKYTSDISHNSPQTQNDSDVKHETLTKESVVEPVPVETSSKNPTQAPSEGPNLGKSVPTSNFLPPMSSVAPPPGFQNPTRKIVYGLAAANPPPGFNRS